jgi:hypothetical protein
MPGASVPLRRVRREHERWMEWVALWQGQQGERSSFTGPFCRAPLGLGFGEMFHAQMTNVCGFWAGQQHIHHPTWHSSVKNLRAITTTSSAPLSLIGRAVPVASKPTVRAARGARTNVGGPGGPARPEQPRGPVPAVEDRRCDLGAGRCTAKTVGGVGV